MSNNFILSRDELNLLTGLVRPGPQKKLLNRRGIPYTTDVVGYPVVTRAAVEGAGGTRRGRGLWEAA